MARPTKYKPEYNEQVEKLARLGATDVEIADFFGVTKQTIYNWKETESEFFDSIKRGKEVADMEVVNSLFKRANGCSTTTDKMCKGEVVTLTTYYPPDPTSMIFWLKNRRPDLWRDRKDIDHTTKGESMNEGLREKTFEELYELKYGHKPARQSD